MECSFILDLLHGILEDALYSLPKYNFLCHQKEGKKNLSLKLVMFYIEPFFFHLNFMDRMEKWFAMDKVFHGSMVFIGIVDEEGLSGHGTKWWGLKIMSIMIMMI